MHGFHAGGSGGGESGGGGGGGNTDSLCSDVTSVCLVRNEWVSD